MRLSAALQRGMRLIYPPTCMTCEALVDGDQGLCGACWRDTPFVGGVVCDHCGTPLMGGDATDQALCDDCLRRPRPWVAGRTTLLYRDNGRKIVLGLKHGDRIEYAGQAGRWMARAGRDLIQPGMVVTAIPLHWKRRVKRRYNQSALLGRAVADATGLSFCPDVLLRPEQTPVLDGVSVEERFEALTGALVVNPQRRALVAGRPVLIIDDVMTSGATFSAATHAFSDAGVRDVRVLTLARAVKDA